MKRTFKRPDGTEEQVEGTAEELAEYERRLRGELAEQKKPPPVLKGAELDGEPVTDQEVEYLRSLRKMIRDPNTFKVPDWQIVEWPKVPTYPVLPSPLYPTPTYPTQPWITGPQKCWICGQHDCRQTHIICETVTWDGTGLLKMIEDHPDWDWSRMNVAGGNWHVQ